MGRSIGLGLYLLVSNHLTGFAERKLKRRLAASAEDPCRIDERRGTSKVARPVGQLIWFHAARNKDALAFLDLITRLRDEDPGLNVMITSESQRSADLLARRLPTDVIHQFAPADARAFIRNFLDHWQPDVAAWTAKNLWPSLIYETHKRDIPIVLLNAGMSKRTLALWPWSRSMANSLLARFRLILTHNATSRERLIELGADPATTKVNGPLQQSGGALPYHEIDRASLAENLGTRPVWLAASTHPGEEDLAVEALKFARGRAHRLILIIAPLDPSRGTEIAVKLREDGWQVEQRSKGEEPNSETDIYVADTKGEMGLWYRLAPVSFVGGSLVDEGGHNPFDPAALGSAILHGPHVENVRDVYDMLEAVGGARQVTTPRELADALIDLLEPQKAAEMAHAAWEVSSSGAEATDNALVALQDILDESLS